MSKVTYKNIIFDSELEVNYYKYLIESNDNEWFIYHPSIPIKITDNNYYTPDFIVGYSDRIEIIETKGYNQFSYVRDSLVHNIMINKTEDELKKWLLQNICLIQNIILIDNKKIIYRKIKYLNKFGWVDFDFKNPNTLLNKRKEKIADLESTLKALKSFKKRTLRYFKLINNPKKKNASQTEFLTNYENEIKEELKNENV